MRGNVVRGEVPYCGAIVRVGPEVPNRVLSPGADPRRFGEIEEHVCRLVEGVQKHEDCAVLTFTAPVLGWV